MLTKLEIQILDNSTSIKGTVSICRTAFTATTPTPKTKLQAQVKSITFDRVEKVSDEKKGETFQ